MKNEVQKILNILTNVKEITSSRSFPCNLAGKFVPREILLSLPSLSLDHWPTSQPGDHLLYFSQTLLLQSLRVHTGLVQLPHVLQGQKVFT